MVTSEAPLGGLQSRNVIALWVSRMPRQAPLTLRRQHLLVRRLPRRLLCLAPQLDRLGTVVLLAHPALFVVEIV
jgi:hypothetical protein